MTRHELLRTAINGLSANIAVLDRSGDILEVNDSWRRFGSQRRATSDYVGFNYLDVCSKAAASGDDIARKAEAGLRRLIGGKADSFGMAYHCGDRTFRMRARPFHDPTGGLLIVHEDITLLLQAVQQSSEMQESLADARQQFAERSNHIYEELGQRLAAISLAAESIEEGGDAANAIAIIHMAVDEARHELRLLRSDAARNGSKPRR